MAAPEEGDKMRNIQERANQLNLNIGQVIKSTDKGKAISQYFKGNMKSFGNVREELDKELTTVLENTVEGIEKLT